MIWRVFCVVATAWRYGAVVGGADARRSGRAAPASFLNMSNCALAAVVVMAGAWATAAVAEPGFYAPPRTSNAEPLARSTDGASRAVMIDAWRSETDPSGSNPVNTEGETSGSAGLLQAARAADAIGDVESAQRLYERIVAQDPMSEAAKAARQRLGAIYRDDVIAADQPAAEGWDNGASAPAAASREPLSDLPQATSRIRPATGSIDTPDGVSRAGFVQAEPAADVVERNVHDAVVASPDLTARQPWRPRARRSHRFEQLLRTDVGDRVFFGVTSAQIGSRARSVLESQAAWLSRYPDLYVVVEGHADEPGSAADNDRIARLRAETVRSLLIRSGLKMERIDIDVRGQKDPVAVCESPDCRSQNRRVVIRLMVVLPSRTGDRESPGGPGAPQTTDRSAPVGAEGQQRDGNLLSRR
jgi:outer membrane protein OmpA-like peptidoglycan-associated protein